MHEAGDVTEDDYATLRYAVSTRRALVDETLGDEGALTVGSVPEILRRAKEAMTREAQDRLQAEARSRHDAEIMADSESQRATAAEISLNSERQKHLEELQSTEQKNKEELARRIGNKAHRRAVRTARVIFFVLALTVIGGALASFGIFAGGVVTVLLVITAILNIRHILFGESLSDLVSRVERRLERKFEETERKSLGI